ncbi:MAG: hypothetical protein CM1200mP12_19890 [Gammaproteobacteria bacterium]|nr:MAG: hypothetical protein CM1200mP12_19890 [Gammaproteobacteria bacterium]
MEANQSHFNVVVVGAGISGIGAGYHLQKQCPNKSFVFWKGEKHLGEHGICFVPPGKRV